MTTTTTANTTTPPLKPKPRLSIHPQNIFTTITTLALLLLILYHLSNHLPPQLYIPNQKTLQSLLKDPNKSPLQCSDLDQEFESLMHGGDCGAIGAPRRPPWGCSEVLKIKLREFLGVYERRPIVSNEGGMKLNHAFALWYSVRTIKPTYIIESGGKDGQSAWLMTQASPNVTIFSFDPRGELPRVQLENVKYFYGKNFIDFAKVDWKKQDIDPRETLILFDDHQDAFRRMDEAVERGFRKMMFDDNWGFRQGDCYSLKWVCEVERKDLWPGKIRDNFYTKEIPKSWEEHLEDGKRLREMLKYYYEFPLVVNPWLIGSNKVLAKAAAPPIVSDIREFRKYGLDKFERGEHEQYSYFAVVETKERAQ